MEFIARCIDFVKLHMLSCNNYALIALQEVCDLKTFCVGNDFPDINVPVRGDFPWGGRGSISLPTKKMLAGE